MPRARNGTIELEYEPAGNPGEPLLLINGLGSQMISWEPGFLDLLAGRGYQWLRFDNRDIGLSTKVGAAVKVHLAMEQATEDRPVDAPYTLSDMAADAAAVLDAVGWEAAHVVGTSMGGMIAQTLAIEHPERVRSLTSIMSTTGDLDVGGPKPAAAEVMMERPPDDREGYIEHQVRSSRVIWSPAHFDEARARQKAAASYDRCFDPAGVGRQLVAVVASGSRSEGLRTLDVPTVVVHGDADPLVRPSAGERTAELIPGAELVMIPGMGHDVNPAFWDDLVDAIDQAATRAEEGQWDRSTA